MQALERPFRFLGPWGCLLTALRLPQHESCPEGRLPPALPLRLCAAVSHDLDHVLDDACHMLGQAAAEFSAAASCASAALAAVA